MDVNEQGIEWGETLAIRLTLTYFKQSKSVHRQKK